MRYFDKLTVLTVPELWKKRSEIFNDTVADLNGSEVDSAGIAFLVRWSKSLGKNKLVLKGCGEDVLKLISIFELKPLFDTSER